MALKNVIIQSIGTAKPSVGKVLADVLGVKNEVVVKLLYCTPSVLFQQIEEPLATDTQQLLTQLGLTVQVTDAAEPMPPAPPLFDIGIFIPNPLQLGMVSQQLADFLGCSEQDALDLLLKDPAVVLGGVSEATATALSQRIDAEVIITDPKTDLYTIKINNKEHGFLKQLDAAFKSAGLSVDAKGLDKVEDIDYAASQQIWQRLCSTKGIEMYNQSFLRYEITLDAVDTQNAQYRQVLTEEVGMPDDIIDEVLQHLPILLNDSVNRKTLQELLQKYNAAGLQCSVAKIPFGDKQLVIENINEASEANAIINQFYKDVTIEKAAKKWIMPKPLNPVLSRLLTQQLQDIGCDVATKPIQL